MKINSVHLYNFSSYAGDNLIDLRTTSNKNVILIGGNNGAGKTSLFTAIKLALYGPQCFKFQDKNHHYFGRIRELINHDAFLSEEVTSFVELELYLPSDRVHSNYTIHREWTVVNKRIEESYSVLQDGVCLNEKDLDFFQNYLYTIIPPNLFDFFFFDGEEVGEFFSTGTYNRYIKNAVLTLSGYDTFSIIEKFCGSFIATEEDNAAYEQAAELAREADNNYTYSKTQINDLTERIKELRQTISKDESEREALEQKFTRSGGLSEKERKKLEKELDRLDSIKSEKSKIIRGFVENMMPLYITRQLAANVYDQLQAERAVQEYQTVLSLLSPETLSEIIKALPDHQVPDEVLVSALSKGISEHIKPQIDLTSFHVIHDMSRDQESQVIAAVSQLKSFNARRLVKDCNDKSSAAKDYDKKAKRLREALPEIDAAAYFARMSQLSKQIEEYKESLARAEVQLENAEQTCEQQAALKERTRKALQVLSKNQTAYVFTEKMGRIMDRMIQSVTREKFKQVEQLTIEKFGSIIRKENFVQLFELDEDFNINLYKQQTYSFRELSAIVKHGGMDALEKRLGSAGIRKALQEMDLQSISDLKSALNRYEDENQLSLLEDHPLNLYNRIELSQLSKGEKQVFILSLYWAIIKTSNQAVPFIIDTPFARIDTEHRERIAEAFFPEVSEQVVILSTDEEVVGDYYTALKPKVSAEYLLDYDPSRSRTVVSDGYFSEVAQ